MNTRFGKAVITLEDAMGEDGVERVLATAEFDPTVTPKTLCYMTPAQECAIEILRALGKLNKAAQNGL